MSGKLILDDGRDIYTSAADGMAAARAKLPRRIAPELDPWRGGPISGHPDDTLTLRRLLALCGVGCAIWLLAVASLAFGLWCLS